MIEQRTCSNCGHFMRDTETKNMGICAVCYFEDANGTDVYRAVWKDQPCGLPLNYIERTDTLEQRHQKLAQIAVDMWETIASDGYPSSVKRYRDELEALGVCVDNSQ